MLASQTDASTRVVRVLVAISVIISAKSQAHSLIESFNYDTNYNTNNNNNQPKQTKSPFEFLEPRKSNPLLLGPSDCAPNLQNQLEHQTTYEYESTWYQNIEQLSAGAPNSSDSNTHDTPPNLTPVNPTANAWPFMLLTEWNQPTGTDIDECLDERACGRGAVCENLPGSFRCVCPAGFTGDPTVECIGKYRPSATQISQPFNWSCRWHYISMRDSSCPLAASTNRALASKPSSKRSIRVAVAEIGRRS